VRLPPQVAKSAITGRVSGQIKGGKAVIPPTSGDALALMGDQGSQR